VIDDARASVARVFLNLLEVFMQSSKKPKYVTEDYLDQKLDQFTDKFKKILEEKLATHFEKNFRDFKSNVIMPLFEITHRHMATKEDIKQLTTKAESKKQENRLNRHEKHITALAKDMRLLKMAWSKQEI
jgi:hypothetical protein